MKNTVKITAIGFLVLGLSLVGEAAMYIPTNQHNTSGTMNANTETTHSVEESTTATTADSSAPSSTFSSWLDSWSHSGDVYDKYEWGVMGYVGLMTGAEMYRDAYFAFEGLGPGTLYTVEVDRQLSKNNWARHYLAPLLFASTIELASNFTYETDPTGPLVEFNPYFVFRWRNFPWNHTVLTTFALGEGVSWASHSPQQELDSEDQPGYASKFLNYVMAEFTFSLPNHPEWQVLYRLHHRSGVFGLYCPGTVGSTAAGIGVRYWMD